MQGKRVLVVLLIVVCFMTLAGCGTTPAPAEPLATSVPPTDTPIPSTPTPEVLKGTVDIWMWTGASDALEAYVPTYNEQFPDVTINVVLIPWDEQAAKYQAAMASGDVPDAFLIDDDQMHAFIESGGLVDVTEYVAPYKDDVAPFKMNFCTRENSIYCVPPLARRYLRPPMAKLRWFLWAKTKLLASLDLSPRRPGAWAVVWSIPTGRSLSKTMTGSMPLSW
jgi:ABC-type glycerol-3-phosphate transport system substrate-binding protein